MFISKSKKGLKPKAPIRRGPEAIAAEEARESSASRHGTPKESTPISQRPQPVRAIETAQSLTIHNQPEESIQEDVHRLSENVAPVSQQVVDEIPTVQEESVSTQQEKAIPRATRSSKRLKATGAVRQNLSPPPTQNVAQEQNVDPTQLASAPITSEGPIAKTPLSPPPTQQTTSASVTSSFIRKSQKNIKPKAATRSSKRLSVPPVTQEEQPGVVEEEPIASTTAQPVVESTSEDVENRLATALTENGFVPVDQESQTQALTLAPAPVESTPTAPKKKKKRQPKNAKSAPIVDDPSAQLVAESTAADVVTESQPPAAKKSRKRKRGAEVEQADAAAADQATQEGPKKKRIRKTKPKNTEASGDAAIDPNLDNDSASQPKKKGKGRKRAATPEDAATQVIAPDEITMAALTVDQQQGKISTRESRLRERDVKQKQRKLDMAKAKARGELEEFMNDPTNSEVPTPNRRRTLADIEAAQSRSESPDAPAAAPQFRIVNGQIVQDESSRVIDRLAERHLAAESDNTNETIIEEDDLSRRITSHSFTKYEKSPRWTTDQTALFHKGLQYFGMEFSMMACLFPGRTRRQLKAKFIREERADLVLVNSLLRNREPFPDKEELEKSMGKKLRDPRELDEELRAQKEALEEAQRIEDQLIEERRLEREREADAEAKRGRGSAKAEDDDEDEDEDEDNDEEEEEEDGSQQAEDDEGGPEDVAEEDEDENMAAEDD